MVLRVYSIYDVKAEAYNTPFFMASNGQALRAFADLVNDGQSAINKHPEDYKLAFLGEFDMKNGDFVPSGVVSLGWGNEYVKTPIPLREIANAS